jgi:3-oxoacyl-[acyl-carrier protein] reductase
MRLDNLSAVVTGGCKGIGAAIVSKLADYGANVAIIDKDKSENLDSIQKSIQDLGRKAIFIQSDTSNYQDAGNAVKYAKDMFGGLHILVNNAGINRDSVIWKMTEEQWDSVLNINLKGYFNYIRHIAPIFKEQNFGKIVNISSINGLRGKFGQSNYSASKAGVVALTKSVARELGKFSVNVNAVAPGLIQTNMIEQLPESVKESALNEIVLNRIGLPEDVADLVVFLCSEKSRHITGEVIKIDGGQYI